MSFELVVNNKGKDAILYNQYKYRESYNLKNGDIVWRCLGKICKASITTNGDKTAIYLSKDVHTGQHPVTMRALTSTPPTQRRDPPAITPDGIGDLSKGPSVSASTPVTLSVSESPSMGEFRDNSKIIDLQIENKALKDELEMLRIDRQVILDHSIETDQRLLQYTDAVFLSPTHMLSKTSSNPELEVILNRLDASNKVNEDLRKLLDIANNENKLLKSRLDAVDAYRPSVKHTGEEIDTLIKQISDLTKAKEKMQSELESKKEIINLLNIDLENISSRYAQQSGKLAELESLYADAVSFQTPKKISRRTKAKSNFQIETVNKFNELPLDESPLQSKGTGSTLQVKAQIHRSDFRTPKSMPTRNDSRDSRVVRRKLLVLTDSQGKGLHSYLNCLEKKYEVFVYSRPGAKMKHIVKDGVKFAKDFTKLDFIIILAGSNDLHHGEPGQYTINQGVQLLLDSVKQTNLIINSVPYRFDNCNLNDRIYFVNSTLSKVVQKYKGSLTVHYNDVNLVLNRSHFTKHGLHYNKHGKRLIGSNLVNIVNAFPGSQNEMPVCQIHVPGEDGRRTTESRKNIVSTVRCLNDPDWSAIEPFPDSSTPQVTMDVATSITAEPCTTVGSQTSLKDTLLYNEKDFPPLPIVRSSSSLCFLERSPFRILDVTI